MDDRDEWTRCEAFRMILHDQSFLALDTVFHIPNFELKLR